MSSSTGAEDLPPPSSDLATPAEPDYSEPAAVGEHVLADARAWPPIFDDLAEPRVVAHFAADAEEAGWDGCFVWDHLWWQAPIRQVADPWITLATFVRGVLRDGPAT